MEKKMLQRAQLLFDLKVSRKLRVYKWCFIQWKIMNRGNRGTCNLYFCHDDPNATHSSSFCANLWPSQKHFKLYDHSVIFPSQYLWNKPIIRGSDLGVKLALWHVSNQLCSRKSQCLWQLATMHHHCITWLDMMTCLCEKCMDDTTQLKEKAATTKIVVGLQHTYLG